MKNNIKTIAFALILGFAFGACDPQEDVHESLGNIVSTSDIKVAVTTPDASKPNDFLFTLTTPSCVGMFKCPELGIDFIGSEFSQYIPWAGNYNFEVTVYNKAGISEPVIIPVIIRTTDPSICDNNLYKLLTGGCSSPDGKKWRIKGEISGHIGCGEEGSSYNNWWNPDPWSLDPALYDDDMTFILNSSQKYVLNNKGASLMNESTASLFPDGNSSGTFVTHYYTPSPNASWAITKNGNDNWLVLKGAVPAYGVNPASLANGQYKIVSITETDMHIVYLPGGISWHYYLTTAPRP